MTAWHHYVFIGGFYAAYVLGLMHAKGRKHWKNVAFAVFTGIVWPLAVVYGAWLAHRPTN